ncbi:hypothetical protein LEMLEM_LOCUS11517 [Lemmus lemmus]
MCTLGTCLHPHVHTGYLSTSTRAHWVLVYIHTCTLGTCLHPDVHIGYLSTEAYTPHHQVSQGKAHTSS